MTFALLSSVRYLARVAATTPPSKRPWNWQIDGHQ